MGTAKTIMIQGTSSNVGKSLLCTALCRIFTDDGFYTAPFKAQNMALNSAVTGDGGEIGRAQAEQAEAAGIIPDVRMNPILLKPKGDMVAQVIVRGRPIGDLSASDYRNHCIPTLIPVVQDCIDQLKNEFEVLVIEGAGSPAEVNLKDRDIVNMKTAEMADAPVLLVADIDRGGVFAALIGTLELLEEHERLRVKGFIINKFRGDLDLLKPGLDFLEQRTGIPVLGVVPYLHDHGIEEEDSVCLADMKRYGSESDPIQIAVVQFPRISNFTDLRPFFHLPDTCLRMVKAGEPIGSADIIILPGTKNTILDLLYLKEAGYDQEIQALAAGGAYIAGICGGYQMMGQQLLDPEGSEAGLGAQTGLRLLPVTTSYSTSKATHQVQAELKDAPGFWHTIAGQRVHGYEIHSGQSEVLNAANALLAIHLRSGVEATAPDGTTSENGKVFGTHLHGFFDNPAVLLAFINAVRQEKGLPFLEEANLQVLKQRQERFERLAQTVRTNIDMEKVFAIMGIEGRQ